MDKINDEQFIEMVASGLRSLQKGYEPDAWIIKSFYIPCTDEKGRIFGKPVYHADFIYDDGWSIMPVYMVPLWLEEAIEIEYHTRCFLEGCEDEWLNIQERSNEPQ